MPTTSNFGWTTPADTDLVKDGAAAIRTLGNGIDTSFVDLKGGTTGQVLAKASNTDLDFTWATDASGIPATIFDAKGDLIAASAADTAARLAVGANGTVLTADSTEATGLKWVAPSAPSFVGCMIYSGASQTISSNTFTAVSFAETDYLDTDNFHNPSTNNSRITIPTGKGGKYFVYGNIMYQSASAVPGRTRIYLNGSGFSEERFGFTGDDQTGHIAAIMTLAAGDYIELFAYQNSGSNKSIYGTTGVSIKATCFGCQFLGA